MTIIKKEYQHQGLVGPLLNHLEEAVGDSGYSYMTRTAAANGYADTLLNHYGPRATTDNRIRHSRHGDQQEVTIRVLPSLIKRR